MGLATLSTAVSMAARAAAVQVDARSGQCQQQALDCISCGMASSVVIDAAGG